MRYARINWLAAAFVVAFAASLGAVQEPEADLRGLVRSPAGPEAGVWVIAETEDLDTLFRKIVVTGDDGRFLVPDLPDAAYRVWVRGYGLVDSEPVIARPGESVTLEATPAPTPQEAAAVYPANYWYSLLEVPAASEFPGTGPGGNGISPALRSQAAWVDITKQGCQLCHQMGNRFTFDISHPRRVRLLGRGVGSPGRLRAARRADERGAEPVRARPRPGDVRRLERPHRRRRGAGGSAPAAGGRAQPRADHVGVGGGGLLRPRRDHHRQAAAHRQRRRPRLRRLDHGGHAGGHRHGAARIHRDSHPAARAHGDGAVDVPDRARLRAVAVLGATRSSSMRRPIRTTR